MSVLDGGIQAGQPAGKEPFPWNRIVAFLGPYLAIISGALATWLLAHFPGLHVDQSTLAADLSEAAVFIVAAAGTFAMHHKWLDGWQQWEKSITEVEGVAEALHPGGTYDPAEFPAELFVAHPASLPVAPAPVAAPASPVPDYAMAAFPAAAPAANGAAMMAPPLVDTPVAAPPPAPVYPAPAPAPAPATAAPAPAAPVPAAPAPDPAGPVTLPSTNQELSSVPDPDQAGDVPPESATKPDVPAHELEQEDY